MTLTCPGSQTGEGLSLVELIRAERGALLFNSPSSVLQLSLGAGGPGPEPAQSPSPSTTLL